MTFDNANRKNIRAAEKESRLAEGNRIAYTRTIMSTIFGRAWMYDLLLRCNIFHTPFVKDSPDSTAFNCGGQNIGLRIFGDVAAHCPNEYTLMMSEASTKEAANDRRYSSESGTDPAGAASEGPRWHPDQSVSTYSIDVNGFVIDTSSDPDPDPRSLEDA